MNWYLYELKLLPAWEDASRWDAGVMEILQAHLEYLQSGHDRAQVFHAGRTDYAPGHADLRGLCIFRAANRAAAEAFAAADPAVQGGIMEARVHDWRFAVGTQPE